MMLSQIKCHSCSIIQSPYSVIHTSHAHSSLSSIVYHSTHAHYRLSSTTVNILFLVYRLSSIAVPRVEPYFLRCPGSRQVHPSTHAPLKVSLAAEAEPLATPCPALGLQNGGGDGDGGGGDGMVVVVMFIAQPNKDGGSKKMIILFICI